MMPPTTPERDKNHRFPAEIISHGVWLPYRFCLSYRDVADSPGFSGKSSIH
jgi:transposase-like protein